MRGDDPRIAALPDIHGHAKGEHKPFAEERPIPYTARMLFLWFFHACRRASPRFLMVADHMNYLTFEDPAAVNLVRRALKLAQAGDLHGAAETAGVELAHAAAVSDGLRKGMRYSIGAEVDNDPRCRPDAQNIVEAMRPDGTIRSVHFVPITHPQHGENWMWAFDNPEFKELYEVVGVERTWELYMATLLEAIDKLPGNIVGHFYVPAKFGHWPDDATLETYEDQLLDACLARGLAVEVNSRYFYKFYAGDESALEKYRVAHLRLLRKAKEKGVMIAVGSDAHSPKDQGAGFEVVLALLDEAGINEIAFPINGRLARVALRATEEILRQHAAALAPVAAATSAAASNGNVPPADSAADEDAEDTGPLPGAREVALAPAPDGEGDGVVATPRKRRPKAAASAPNGTGGVIAAAATEATRAAAPPEHEPAPAAQERPAEGGWDNDGATPAAAEAVVADGSEERPLQTVAEETVRPIEQPALAAGPDEPAGEPVAEESHPPALDGMSPSIEMERAMPVAAEASPIESEELAPDPRVAEPANGSRATGESGTGTDGQSRPPEAPKRPRVRAPKRVQETAEEAESAPPSEAPAATGEATDSPQSLSAAPSRKPRPSRSKVRAEAPPAEASGVVTASKRALETAEAPAHVAVASASKAAPEKRSRPVASAKAAPSAPPRSKKTALKVAAPKRPTAKKAEGKPASAKAASAKKATSKGVSAKKTGAKKTVAKKAATARSSGKRPHNAATAKGGPAKKSAARATKRVLAHKANGKKSLPKKPAAKKRTKSRR